MKKIIKLIAYISAFVVLMPQIFFSMVQGAVTITFAWYAIFILWVEGSTIVFERLVSKPVRDQWQRFSDNNKPDIEPK